MYRAGNDKVLHRAAGAQHSKQALAVCIAVDIQAGDGMTVAVKRTGERLILCTPVHIHADRCPGDGVTRLQPPFLRRWQHNIYGRSARSR